MTNLDITAATRRCATELDGLGLSDWAGRLRDAIDSASTGGELVMGVRHQLRSLRASGQALPADLGALIEEIIVKIDGTGW